MDQGKWGVVKQEVASHVQPVVPMDCSMLGSSILHYFPEFAQIHVHCVSDDISPSHPFTFSLSQHQSIF